jgi:hypothetical protein
MCPVMPIAVTVIVCAGIVVVVVVVVVYACWQMCAAAAAIHARLDEIMHDAACAKTLQELFVLETTLRDYAATECRIRAFGQHAREIMHYIKGRQIGCQCEATKVIAGELKPEDYACIYFDSGVCTLLNQVGETTAGFCAACNYRATA